MKHRTNGAIERYRYDAMRRHTRTSLWPLVGAVALIGFMVLRRSWPDLRRYLRMSRM